MQRTKFNDPNIVSYSLEDEPIVFSKHLIDTLLKYGKHFSNLFALYGFYYYTAKWQKTNQPKATANYVAQGIGWNVDKVRQIKGMLKEIGLIENIIEKDKRNKITGHYVKVNFIWSKHNSHPSVFPGDGKFQGMENSGTNALSNNNINALSTNTPKKNNIIPIVERNEVFLPIARYLYKIIQTNKNINHPMNHIKTWANDIRILSEQNKIPPKRIKTALRWYKKNIGGEYIPIIESGNSLRFKFLKLEAAIERSKNNYSKPKQKSIGYREPDYKFKEPVTV